MPASFMILVDKEKRVFLCDGLPDAAGGDAVTLQRGKCGVGGFGRDGDQQAAGGLGIEK